MNKRSVRWRKPNQKNWVYLKVEEDKVDDLVAYLESKGYIVEC